jgi:hypothetical protein
MEGTTMFLDIFIHVPKCAGRTVRTHIENQYSAEERFDPHHPYYLDKISRVLGAAERKICQTNWPLIKKSWINSYLTSLSPTQRDAIRCISGHAAYYGIHELFERQPRYFVFLREPLARFVSYYNYMGTVRVTPERLIKYEIQRKNGTIRSVDEWLEESNLNLHSMSSFLLHTLRAENLLQSFTVPSLEDMEDVRDMLSSFYFVGLTENKDDMEFTLRQLGIKSRLSDTNVLRTKDTYLKPANLDEARKIVAEKCPFDIELYDYAVQLNREKKAQLPEYDTAAR